MKYRINMLYKCVNVMLGCALLISLFCPFSKTYAYPSYALNGTKLNTDYDFVMIPHEGFGSTTISHFNEALWQWNRPLGFTLMSRSATQRHNDTGFPKNDDQAYIYRESNTSVMGPGQARRYRSNPFSSVLRSADILINTAFKFTNSSSPKSNEYDTWTVFLHEAGHVAGLDHHPAGFASSSVMVPHDPGGTHRYLQSDDISGIQAIYLDE